MEIIHYQEKKTEEYLNYVQKKYRDIENFDVFFKNLKTALDFSFISQKLKPLFLKLVKNDQIVGHVGLFINNKKSEAFFGFFEVENDEKIFMELWEEILKLARNSNIKIIKGPINGTTWHQYRCIRKNNKKVPFFDGELICENYYYNFFKRLKPSKEIFYYSGYRENIRIITVVTKPSYEKAIQAKFKIKKIKKINLEKMRILYDTSRKIFQKNWGYIDFDFEDFLKIYTTDKASRIDVYTLEHKNKMIGFCLINKLNDLAVMKTIGVLPKYQGKGLGNALVYYAHLNLVEEGCKRVIYGLVREDNQVKHFPNNDIKFFRNYSVFEFTV